MASVLILRMVTMVVGGSAKAARASGIDIGYTIYFFLSVVYRWTKNPLLQSNAIDTDTDTDVDTGTDIDIDVHTDI
jgi:hypothetical protein